MSVIRFPPFVLDRDAAMLERGGEPVHLRPRTWDVLCYLAEHPGRLVTKDDLLDAVWSDAVVSEGTLTNSIRELRAALGDDARSPRYIETVHRRGFRFVAEVVSGDSNAAPTSEPRTGRPLDDASGGGKDEAPPPARRPLSTSVVARDEEARALTDLAAEVAEGAVRVALVRGEAGIGKSSVVERFVSTIGEPGSRADHAGMIAGVGRAVGYLQGAPPYLPLLSALEQLATGEGGTAVIDALRVHAPDLLLQMPWLAPVSESAPPAHERRDLAVRLVDFLAAVSDCFPVALVLEDLHDADAPTVAFVESLLEEPRLRRLLVLATYRPGEAVLAPNGLASAAARIETQAGARVFDLELLGLDAVAGYLRSRDPSFWSDAMIASVHRRSGGNPLFMVTVADTIELLGSGANDSAAIPDSLRGLLETQLRSLDYAQREMLMAASAAGVEFSSLAVASATGRSVDEVEEACEQLASQSRFIKSTGVADWPSGAVGQAYAFRHDLYRQALYATIPAARRQLLHQRIGEALEAGFGNESFEVASQLADQFCKSGDAARAIRYLREAAGTARQRSAHRESLELLDRALGLAGRLADADDRDPAEFAVQVERAVSAGTLYGYGSTLSRQACERVAELGARLPASFDRYFSLLVVFGYQITRSDVTAATALAEQMTRMAESLDMPLLGNGARSVSSMAASARGDFALADEGFRSVVREVPGDIRFSNFRDVLCPSLAAMAQNLCYLDRRAKAESVAAKAVERADWLGDPFERANSRATSAYCAALYDDRAQALGWAREVEEIAREHAIEELAAIAEIFVAWADEAARLSERRARAASGIRGLERSGRLLGKAFFLGLLAELEIADGDFTAAASTLAAARGFCESTGSYRHLSELCRRTAFVESKLDPLREASGRDWLAESKRIAEGQACALTLRRLEEDSGRRTSAS